MAQQARVGLPARGRFGARPPVPRESAGAAAGDSVVSPLSESSPPAPPPPAEGVEVPLTAAAVTAAA